MAHVRPVSPSQPNSAPSLFSLAYTLDFGVSRSLEDPVSSLAVTGEPDVLGYTYRFTIDAGLLHTVAGGAAILLFCLLFAAVLPRVAWRAIGRGVHTSLARAAAAAAVAAVLGGGVARFVWRDVAVPAAPLLLLAGRTGWAGAQSMARCSVAAAAAATRRWWLREHVVAVRRSVIGVFKAVVVATAVLALISAVVWVVGRVGPGLLVRDKNVPLARGVNVRAPALTMADYDEIARSAKARWERPIHDWTWADGYVTRPCRFPQCVFPEDD